MPGSPSGFQAVDRADHHYFAISSHDIDHTDRIGATSGASAAWVSGLGVYVPFSVEVASIIYEWFNYNGTLTTSHNIDFGIYNLDFTKVQSLGSTAGGTTASVLNNTTTWTDLLLPPGSYYMAMCDDSTRNFTMTSDSIGLYQAQGVMEQTGLSSTLPSPAVPVAYTRAFLPIFGMNLYTVAL
jgi:hypothetical protein